MFKGFRDFIMRGNVVDLAVAVVIGAAFSAVVSSIANGLITPLVRVILGGNADNLGGQVTINGQVFDFALVINAIITFLITAAVVYFVFVLPMNTYRERQERGKPTDSQLNAEEVLLLREIRDLLAGRGSSETPPA